MLTGPAGAVFAVAVLVGGPAATAYRDQPPDTDEVRIVAVDGNEDAPFAFDPLELTIEAGETVTWRNTTAEVFHTITFTDSLSTLVANGVFDGSLFAAGDTVEYVFEEAGTYHYFCQPHSTFMAGTVVVTESDVSPWRRVALVAAAVVVASVAGSVLWLRSRRGEAGP